MILIISSDGDVSTNHTIEWLLLNKEPFVRINNSTKVFLKELILNNDEIDAHLILRDNFYHDFEIKLSDVKSVWYRRGGINLNTHQFLSKQLNSKKHKNFNLYLKKELTEVEDLIYYILAKKKCVNTYFDDVEINKSYVLWCASQCGLKIPKNCITSYPDVIENRFQDWNQEMITKALKYSFLKFDNKVICAGTEKIKIEHLKETDTFLFPSLFQNQIDKAFEVRTFYLNDKFYSSAIFSQSDEQTSVDFRNYNHEKPNRTPPFELPQDIEDRLIVLMKRLNYNSGSIDIVVDKKGEYIFLEVNPVGQFHQVSYPCNYFIEEKIAKFLKNNEKS